MVIINFSLQHGYFETHTYINFVASFAPFVELTCLFLDGFMKLCNDQSMVFHIIIGTPHKTSYLG